MRPKTCSITWGSIGSYLGLSKIGRSSVADRLEADAKRADLSVPATDLEENRKRLRITQETSVHEVGESAAAPVGRWVALDL